MFAFCSISGLRRNLVRICDRDECKGKGMTINPLASGMAAAGACGIRLPPMV